MSIEHLPGLTGPSPYADLESVLTGGRARSHSHSHSHLSLVPDAPEAFAEDLFDPATATGEEWQERALCAQTDPEAFFPEKGGSTREAKKICQRCPVRNECLEYALSKDERFGIWGGLSERERRRLKRGII